MAFFIRSQYPQLHKPGTAPPLPPFRVQRSVLSQPSPDSELGIRPCHLHPVTSPRAMRTALPGISGSALIDPWQRERLRTPTGPELTLLSPQYQTQNPSQPCMEKQVTKIFPNCVTPYQASDMTPITRYA